MNTSGWMMEPRVEASGLQEVHSALARPEGGGMEGVGFLGLRETDMKNYLYIGTPLALVGLVQGL
jgi:hypothetical protein